MARDVLVDVSNILTEINKGNETTAKALKNMNAGGVNLYYDEQGYPVGVTGDPMTTLSVEEFRAQPDQYLAEAANGDVILTQDDLPERGRVGVRGRLARSSITPARPGASTSG